MSYYIGVDGGGTKTQYALFDEKKNMLASVKTEGTNHETMDGGIPAAARILMQGIESLLLNNALMQKEITFCLMALAGMDHPYQEEAMAKALKKAGLKIPFSLYNDGFIVVKAGVSGKAGIGYNCGTGTCCNSIDSDGKLLQIGGFGALSGDVGGGLWIAANAYRLVYNEVVLGGEKTLCTKKMVEKFGSWENAHAVRLRTVAEKHDAVRIREIDQRVFEGHAQDHDQKRKREKAYGDRLK